MQAYNFPGIAIKLIALDLDDTTLSHDGTLSEINRAALEAAIDRGIEIVVASGRNFTSLPKCIAEISGIRYAIVSNGAAVYDIESGRRIGGSFLSEESVVGILKSAPETGEHCYEVIMDGRAYCERRYVEDPIKYSPKRISPYIGDYIRRTRTPVDDIYAFALKNIHKLDCMNIVCKSGDACEALHRHLESSVAGIYMTSSVPHLLEISHCDAGKGSGLRFICNHLGISLSDTASCGNADNDVDMLTAAGIGAAVLNASSKCTASADIIIGSSNDSGVGHFVSELLEKNS